MCDYLSESVHNLGNKYLKNNSIISIVDRPTSQRNDLMIDAVEIICEQRTDGSGIPVLWFTCQFDTVSDYFYTVLW